MPDQAKGSNRCHGYYDSSGDTAKINKDNPNDDPDVNFMLQKALRYLGYRFIDRIDVFFFIIYLVNFCRILWQYSDVMIQLTN